MRCSRIPWLFFMSLSCLTHQRGDGIPLWHQPCRRRGRVVALGSVNQWRQSPRLPIYAATKSAISNLIQNCARKYAADGITFNTIAPGVIATDRNTEALADQEIVEKLLTVIPAKRFGLAEDCAGIALLLASDAGSYITGCDIPVAGGMQL